MSRSGSGEPGHVIDSLRGKEVVISGDFRRILGLTKAVMRERATECGAAHVGEDVRSTTDVFVKGESPLYKYDSFGDREAELAARAPHAWVIDAWGFKALLERRTAPAWKPLTATGETVSRPPPRTAEPTFQCSSCMLTKPVRQRSVSGICRDCE
jgi:hypothetical protein